MPLVYLYPNGTVFNDMTLQGAATAHEATDDVHGAEDGDTTRVYGGSASVQHAEVNMDDMPIGVGAIVNLSNHASLYCQNVNWMVVYVRIAAANYLGVQNSSINTWQKKEGVAQAASPVTAIAWTVSEINGATAYVYKPGDSGIWKSCSAVHWAVNYINAAGSFVHLLSQWLPPILAMASHGLLKREVSQILSSLKVQPSLPEDFARIFEALRRRPVYGYLGI